MLRLIKLLIITFFALNLFVLKGFCSSSYTVKNLVIDNSDNVVLIEGEGNFRKNVSVVYIPTPGQSSNSTNKSNNISTFTIENPNRYVVDIPNAVLIGSSRTYKINNSSTLKSVAISQFSTNPNVVRAVFMLQPNVTSSKFKTYTNGTNIIVSYDNQIVTNSIQRKFYTPNGDMDKSANVQNTGAVLTYSTANEAIDLSPKLKTKYLLSKISQNSDGLILRGMGEIAFQRAIYNEDNTQAALILDNARLSKQLENKTYIIPSSNKENSATLTLSTLNEKKVKLVLNAKNARDFRFVAAPDGQSLFISHRAYIIGTLFSSDTPKVTSYKMEKTQTGYDIFSINFSQSVAYDVFELNDYFYLDINNLSDYNSELFNQMLKTTDIDIKTLKISSDKTRFIIPTKNEKFALNFSYANVESNSKSIKICFKRKIADTPVVIAKSTVDKDKNSQNTNVIYIPKDEDEGKIKKPNKNKDNMTISSMTKVVIDPGHGGNDGGAIRGTYYEKNLNLTVAKLVQEKLTKKNVYVYMTRTKDTTLSLEDRVNFSNNLSPDIYVSIHTNSTVGGESYGLETHYYKDDSIDLAKTIHSNFASNKNLKKWDTKDRGVIKSRFYVINHTEAPSVLIEIGFISNVEERTKLFTKERQEEIADSIAKGILEYLKVK